MNKVHKFCWQFIIELLLNCVPWFFKIFFDHFYAQGKPFHFLNIYFSLCFHCTIFQISFNFILTIKIFLNFGTNYLRNTN